MGQYSYGGQQYGRNTSWQQSRENEARDRWDREGKMVDDDVARSGRDRGRYQGQADEAYDRFGRLTPGRTAAWNPSNTEGYRSARTDAWLAGAGGSSLGGSEARDEGIGALAGFNPDELGKFSSDDVSNFDPSAFGKEFYGGAQGAFQLGLGDDLDALREAAVGRGRLGSGFYDKDVGSIVNRNSAQFANTIAQAATVFSGQKLGALESGAGMRLDRARGIDELNFQKASGRDSNAITAQTARDRFNLGKADNELGWGKAKLDASMGADELDYRRAHDLDTMGWDKAAFGDDFDFRRDSQRMNTAADRERTYMDDYGRNRDRAADYASSNRDWAAMDRQMQDERDFRAREDRLATSRMAGNRYGTPDRGRGIAGSPARTPMSEAEAQARRLADQLHVPYRDANYRR